MTSTASLYRSELLLSSEYNSFITGPPITNRPTAQGAPMSIASLMPVLLAFLTVLRSLRAQASEMAGTKLMESASVSTAGILVRVVT